MSEDFEARLWAVESELAIRNLIARYAMVMDDRDIASIPALFTRDGRLWTGDGKIDARGRDALVRTYEGRFEVLGASSHLTHGAEICVEGKIAARGKVTSTAEVFRDGKHQLASLRYNDTYAFEDGAWRIAAREMLYFYFVPVDSWAGVLGILERNQTYAVPIPADVPERTTTFRAYESSKGRPPAD